MAIVWTFPVLSTPDVRSVTLDVTSIPKKSTQEETFPVPDLLLTDHVDLIKPTDDSGITVIHARVSAVDTLAVVFWNQTNTNFDPASQDFTLLVSRG